MHQESLKISGMSCAACAARIEKGLKKIEGVESVNVNLALERATVNYDENKLKREQIDQVVQKLGYDVIPENLDEQATLQISGMTCAACAARIEKKLNSLEGVTRASVNLSTEKAMVSYRPGQVRVSEMIRSIQNLGYNAERVEDISADRAQEEKDKEIRSLRWLLTTSAVLSLPLVVAMVLSLFRIHNPIVTFLHNPYFQWVIATPVQFVGPDSINNHISP